MDDKQRDWGKFFKQMFQEGAQFTEELLKENERLRQKTALLEHEAVQRKRNANERDIQETLVELKGLRKENQRLNLELAELKKRYEQVERENADFAEKHIEIERRNSNFASLYVASYQLHVSLDFDVVVQNICEIVINLIGAECFGVFVFDPKNNAFILVGGEGIEGHQKGSSVPLGNNLLSRVARSGELYLDPDVTTPGSFEHPIAALPLVASKELVGMLTIYKLLIQKDGFEPIDMELFNLLGGHAGTALMASQIYSRSQRKASTLEHFLQVLKSSAPVEPPAEES